jgi:hypothetical protein
VNNQLTVAQKLALVAYANTNGAEWKNRLLVDWMSGKCRGELQQIRNNFGPKFIKTFTL